MGGRQFIRIVLLFMFPLLVINSCTILQTEKDIRRDGEKIVKMWFKDFKYKKVRKILESYSRSYLELLRIEINVHPLVVKNNPHPRNASFFSRSYRSLMAEFDDLLGELRYDKIIKGKIYEMIENGNRFIAMKVLTTDNTKITVFSSGITMGDDVSDVDFAQLYIRYNEPMEGKIFAVKIIIIYK